MDVKTIGIDLAKEVLQIHGVDEHSSGCSTGNFVQVTAFFTKLPPCLIGMEACAFSHYWVNTQMS